VEEEADECCFWLDLVASDKLLPPRRVASLQAEAHELTAIIVSSIRTAKGRRTKKTSAIRVPPSPLHKIGHGFDLHRLVPDKPLVVCGQTLEHDRGCDAHSDGDVVYHAVTDAILGALAMDDIGQLFPNTDPKWHAADSTVFVEDAIKRMRNAGYAVGNLDVTVILEKPKLGPHKTAMRENLAHLLDSDLSQVNLKGKTHEQVDALGENRAIACHAVVLLAPTTG